MEELRTQQCLYTSKSRDGDQKQPGKLVAIILVLIICCCKDVLYKIIMHNAGGVVDFSISMNH